MWNDHLDRTQAQVVAANEVDWPNQYRWIRSLRNDASRQEPKNEG